MTGEARQRLLSACFRFLRPIAKVLLASGVSFQEFERVSRFAFVKVASEEFGVRGRETNSARISAMTGIPRKEVAKLREQEIDEFVDPRSQLSPLSDVLHIWATSTDYADDRGVPLPLTTDGDAPSLRDLVKRCHADVTTGSVKKELVRLGAIEEEASGLLHLRRRALIPDDFDENLIAAFSYRLAGLASTIAHNVYGRRRDTLGRFERYVESRPLTPREITEVRGLVRLRLEELSEDLDNLLNSGTAEASDETRRVGVGLYFSE